MGHSLGKNFAWVDVEMIQFVIGLKNEIYLKYFKNH